MRHRLKSDDQGIALLSTLLVLLLLMALGSVVAITATAAEQSAHRDLVAGQAFYDSDAGVSEAAAYFRTNGVGTINTCFSTPTSCPYTVDATYGAQLPAVTTTTGTYTDYLKPVSSANELLPPTSHTGLYQVHSVGTLSTGATQIIDEELQIAPYSFPFGIYTAQSVSQGGGLTAANESLFTGGCVNKRQQISLSGTDAYYGIPAAVHSAKYITTSKNNCSATDSGDEHLTSKCNTSYSDSSADQDALGATVASPCNPPGAQAAGSCTFPYPATSPTSAFSPADLACYAPNPRGLPQSGYDQLEQTAVTESSYFTTPSYTAPNATTYPQGVLYINLNNTTNRSVSLSSITGYDSTQCGTRSIIIVVIGGDVTINAGVNIVGAVFAPDGTVKLNGSATIDGTIFAQSIDGGAGSASIGLQSCYVTNPPAPLLDISVYHFHQEDR
jgi:Tfp pilus assembly protein PilX